MELVTGYKGTSHVTASQTGAYNASLVGSDQYVLQSGNMFKASVISNNTIRILDGDLLMQGRHITIEHDAYEDMTIANGISGMNRKDLIVVRYTKNAETGVESASLVVIHGTSTSGTASDPEYNQGDILSGSVINDMPLYRISLEGLTVGEPEAMFETVSNFKKIIADVSSLTTRASNVESRVSKVETRASTAESNISTLQSKLNSLRQYDISKDNVSIALGEVVEVEIPMELLGYTYIGVCGFAITNASSSGGGGSYANVISCYKSGYNAIVKIKNLYTGGAIKIKVYACGLYIKN